MGFLVQERAVETKSYLFDGAGGDERPVRTGNFE